MVWIRVDDHFDEHPKMAAVGPLGVALWLSGLAYCNRNLTDGFIPWAIARTLHSWQFLGSPATDGKPRQAYRVTLSDECSAARSARPIPEPAARREVDSEFVIDLLLAQGLWYEVDGGYQVHDYAEFQPLRETVEANSHARQEAGRAGGKASAAARRAARADGLLAPGVQPANEDEARARAKPNPDPGPDPGSTASYEAVESGAEAPPLSLDRARKRRTPPARSLEASSPHARRTFRLPEEATSAPPADIRPARPLRDASGPARSPFAFGPREPSMRHRPDGPDPSQVRATSPGEARDPARIGTAALATETRDSLLAEFSPFLPHAEKHIECALGHPGAPREPERWAGFVRRWLTRELGYLGLRPNRPAIEQTALPRDAWVPPAVVIPDRQPVPA